MTKKIDFMDDFRAKENKAVYVLSIVMVRGEKKEASVSETIDAYKGEVGIRYARNLLLRMGNYVISGTELEKIPWEEDKMFCSGEGRDWGYIKSNENGDYILATANWYRTRDASTKSLG